MAFACVSFVKTHYLAFSMIFGCFDRICFLAKLYFRRMGFLLKEPVTLL